MVHHQGMSQFKTIDFAIVVDLFLLLLIGIGPKIALVPFLDVTANMDGATKARVMKKMLTTASIVALALVLFGGLLTRLLHFSTGALSIAGGLILLIIAVTMVLSRENDDDKGAHRGKDPMQTAVYPLAVPYLLNPAGIVVIVTASADAASVGFFALVIALLALVLLIDVVVFRWANHVSKHLDQNRMLVTEKVFGFLLAALAIQLVLDGLADLGVIHLTGH
jgi:small neutral amino acid transporter SnatA (MarC family)